MTTDLIIKKLSDWNDKNKLPIVIAGPCSAESEQQMLATAAELAKNDKISYFRAGVWKPRTRPGSFEGAGIKALEWMKAVKEQTGLKVATEVANGEHVAGWINIADEASGAFQRRDRIGEARKLDGGNQRTDHSEEHSGDLAAGDGRGQQAHAGGDGQQLLLLHLGVPLRTACGRRSGRLFWLCAGDLGVVNQPLQCPLLEDSRCEHARGILPLHHGADRVVGLEAVESLVELTDHLAIEGVERLGPVEGNEGDGAAQLGLQRGVVEVAQADLRAADAQLGRRLHEEVATL